MNASDRHTWFCRWMELQERKKSFAQLWKMYRRLPVLASARGLRLGPVELRPVRREVRRQIGVMRRLKMNNPFCMGVFREWNGG